MSRSLRLTESF